MAKAPAATMIGPTSAVRAPTIVRESTSRPSRSVPAQNSAEGGVSPTSRRWVSGEPGAIAEPKTAQIDDQTDDEYGGMDQQRSPAPAGRCDPRAGGDGRSIGMLMPRPCRI